MLDKWFRTVCGLNAKSLAMAPLLAPRRMARTMSCSRGVRTSRLRVEPEPRVGPQMFQQRAHLIAGEPVLPAVHGADALAHQRAVGVAGQKAAGALGHQDGRLEVAARLAPGSPAASRAKPAAADRAGPGRRPARGEGPPGSRPPTARAPDAPPRRRRRPARRPRPAPRSAPLHRRALTALRPSASPTVITFVGSVISLGPSGPRQIIDPGRRNRQCTLLHRFDRYHLFSQTAARCLPRSSSAASACCRPPP